MWLTRVLTLFLIPLAFGGAVTAFAEDAASSSGRHIRRIEWQGAEAVKPDELADAILTESASWRPWVESRPFDSGAWEQDLERIARLYQRKGFYQAKVQATFIHEGTKKLAIRVEIDEGQKVVLGELHLAFETSGIAEAPIVREEMCRGLPLEAGKGFDSESYEQAKAILLRRLAQRGYPSPRISGGATVDVDFSIANVDWRIDPGPYVRFGVAHIAGLEEVNADLVRGEIKWKEGEPFDPRVLRETQRSLFDLGLFRSVQVQPVRPDSAEQARAEEEVWPLEIRVIERAPRSLRAAVGYGTEDGVRVKAEWKHRNFFGGLRKVRLGGKYSFLERGIEAVFVQPRFLDQETRLTVDTVLSEETEPAFDSRGISMGWLIDRTVYEGWKGRIGQRLEFRKVTNVASQDALVQGDENESFQLHVFEVGLRRSTLDAKLDPTRGSWIDLELEPSFTELGSDVSYVKALAEARVFAPLPLGLVLGGRVRLGVLEPFGGSSDSDVPIFKRLFSGGSSSVRGFDLDALGPLGEDEDPLGGLTLAEASLELRFPIWRALGGVAFADAGQVALDSFELRGDDFFYSAGGGLRYKTPIGPLRLDFARILNAPSGISDFRVHFSVGHAF